MYLQTHKEAALKVKSRNVNNVKAFRKGRDHLAEDLPEKNSPNHMTRSSWLRCAIQ